MYLVLKCRKCGHELYIDANYFQIKKFAKIPETDCPECGEEGYENWLMCGTSYALPKYLTEEEDED